MKLPLLYEQFTAGTRPFTRKTIWEKLPESLSFLHIIKARKEEKFFEKMNNEANNMKRTAAIFPVRYHVACCFSAVRYGRWKAVVCETCHVRHWKLMRTESETSSIG